MDVLFCLAERKDREYQEHSVHMSFQNAIIEIYDIAICKFREIVDEMGPEDAKKYITDLRDLNSIRAGYKPDRVTYLFNKRFRITKVHNRLTSKDALVNIVEHINARFRELSHMEITKKICFPLEILDEKVKSKWYNLDEYNAENAIQFLEMYIQDRIDELKLKNMETVQGILERNNEDFIAVRFTDSQEFLLNKEIFSIVVSPNTGYNLSLTAPEA